MTSLRQLEKEIEKIKERNRRVEADKSWELSYSRRIILMIFTYSAIGFYGSAINIPQPWFNAIIPAFALFLSTLTLPFFKKSWLKHIYKK